MKKKKILLIPISLIAISGTIVGAGFSYWMFGQKGEYSTELGIEVISKFPVTAARDSYANFDTIVIQSPEIEPFPFAVNSGEFSFNGEYSPYNSPTKNSSYYAYFNLNVSSVDSTNNELTPDDLTVDTVTFTVTLELNETVSKYIRFVEFFNEDFAKDVFFCTNYDILSYNATIITNTYNKIVMSTSLNITNYDFLVPYFADLYLFSMTPEVLSGTRFENTGICTLFSYYTDTTTNHIALQDPDDVNKLHSSVTLNTIKQMITDLENVSTALTITWDLNFHYTGQTFDYY